MKGTITYLHAGNIDGIPFGFILYDKGLIRFLHRNANMKDLSAGCAVEFEKNITEIIPLGGTAINVRKIKSPELIFV